MIIHSGKRFKMTFEEFLEEFMADEDVWNMSLEEYNFLKARAKEIYEIMQKKEESD
jgi:hypothetical protein